MTDYIKEIQNGTMLIRDTGGDVEFWFKTGSSTWNNQQDWGWSLDGGGFNMGVFKLSTGGAWHHLGTINVGPGGNRQVGMRIVGEGLGWPTTDHYATVVRATAPPAPSMQSAVAVSTSEADVLFYSAGDGGSGILEWQIGYGTDPWYPQYYVGSGGSTRVGGLSSGAWWYFWARGRNALGWSGWSGRVQAFTWRVPDAPSPVTLSLITQTSLRTEFSGGFDGGEPVDQWQLAYGLSSDVAAATLVTSTGTLDLANLVPGRIYYFWARGRNAVGWGPYSPVRLGVLVAGALIKNQNTFKRAVPYVKVNGIWKLARPWAKSAGTWKQVP